MSQHQLLNLMETSFSIVNVIEFHGNQWVPVLQSLAKILANFQKRRLCFTPQAMYNLFKRPTAGSVSELHYTYRKT